MTGPDVEWLDPEGRPTGADEVLDPAADERPRRRWPLALGALLVVAAVVTAVLTTGDEPRRDPVARTTGPVIPGYSDLRSGPASSSTVDEDCPRPTSCALRPASVAVLARVGLVLRPLIGAVRTLSVVDSVKQDGVVAERTIGATGDDGVRVAVVVSDSDRPPDLSRFTGGIAFGRAFSGGRYVNAALSPTRADARALAELDRVAQDPRLLP